MAENNGAPTKPRRRSRAAAADATTMQPAEALVAAAPAAAVDNGTVAPAASHAAATAPAEAVAGVRPSAAAADATSAPAEAPGAAVAAGAVATTIAEPVETIEFEFTADRFGNNPDTEGMEGIYARDAVAALDHWNETVQQLFGDPDSGIEVAGNTRIIMAFPSLSATEAACERLGSYLGTTRLPLDQDARNALEDVRNYLRNLESWAETFEAGLWIATLAGQGAAEGTAQSRLLAGLTAIQAVCQYNSNNERESVLDDMRVIAAQAAAMIKDRSAPVSVPPGIAFLIETADAALRFPSPVGSFVEVPERLHAWSERLRERLNLPPSEKLTNEAWMAIEHAYWQQWDWPTAGAVARRVQGNATFLDLMMAARLDGATLLNWRGGLLTIFQWSRLLSIATPDRLAIMREAAGAALAQLGFASLVGAFTAPEGTAADAKADARGKKPPPLVALSIYAENSAAASWRTEAGVRAFALMPHARAQADRRLLGAKSESLLERIAPSCAGEREVARLHLVEWPARVEFVKVDSGISEAISRLSDWDRVYFGPVRLTKGEAPRVRLVTFSAGSITELVQTVLQKYPRLFPGELSPLVRLYSQFQETWLYERVREWPSIQKFERDLGLRSAEDEESGATPT